ncbi:MAG TPA: thiamine pyrophosphate-dependent enzyme [Thermomicrobiales bacterium]|nr:thiamine pyrophosphate-dependent enzyme [Thermomicrobiales bacterium]
MAQVAEKSPAKTAIPSGKRTMTGGEALVQSLIQEGIDTIFGLPGVQLDGAFDALYHAQDQVRVVHTRHEQATAYMADGYARSTGRIGTCLVVPGPGLLNASAALSTAYACNSPVLCVSGQIPAGLIGVGRGMLHEIPNQLQMIRSVTKHAARAMTPGEVPALVRDAFHHLRSGRSRPVEIEVPQDTLLTVDDIALLPPAPPRARPSGDPDLIAKAAKLLGEAERPIIYSGGGVLIGEAWEELRQLAELLQAPVVMTNNGKGALSDRDYLAHNTVAGMELLPDADVIFAVGTRFVEPSTSRWGLAPGRTVIQLDIDPEEIGRNYPVTVGIQADAQAGLAALSEQVGRYNRIRASREDELRALKQGVRERLDSVNPQAELSHAIRNELPDEGIFVSEMTQIGYWSWVGYPVYSPRTFITPGYQGTLGYGFPTSLGVKVGNPNTPVVSVNGDGGFGFALNELATMARHDIRTVVIVFDDDAYGNVRRIQRDQFDGRTIASDLHNPDFVKLAEAFGVAGRRAKDATSLQTQLREAIRADEPTLIHVPVGTMPNPWTVLGLR